MAFVMYVYILVFGYLKVDICEELKSKHLTSKYTKSVINPLHIGLIAFLKLSFRNMSPILLNTFPHINLILTINTPYFTIVIGRNIHQLSMNMLPLSIHPRPGINVHIAIHAPDSSVRSD